VSASATEERRAFPRVRARAPMFVAAITRSERLRGDGIEGQLVDASRGGLSFAARAVLARGDLVEISVSAPDGTASLDGVYGQVVGTSEHPEHGAVVHLAFTTPTADDGWLPR
jgi:hypothetical protein